MKIPSDYKALLDIREREEAIKTIKDHFERQLAKALNLQRVTAPFFVKSGLGLNDDLNGVEKPVSFKVTNADCTVEVVQSLAKWKRLALKRYGFKVGEGLYTDMNAIRPDETLDEIHSFYVDQWDWCKIIDKNERNLEKLKDTVRSIYSCIVETERFIAGSFSQLTPSLPDEITFISAEDLLKRYPTLSPKERETEVCKEYGAIFVIGIGAKLSNGEKHDGRAPDYDDWSTVREDGGLGLNGDILVWNPVLESAFELSSMGIRVDSEALKRQLKLCNCEERLNLSFHKMLVNNELPQTMGGGIGQSRLCMLMLRCAHIGEVACGMWPEEMTTTLTNHGITLL